MILVVLTFEGAIRVGDPLLLRGRGVEPHLSPDGLHGNSSGSRPTGTRSRTSGLGVLFHHSGMGFDETIERMLGPGEPGELPLPDRHADGTRCSLVPDTEVAWHAGRLTVPRARALQRLPARRSRLRATPTPPPFPAAQVASALEWLGARWARLGWGLDRITDHRQASPGRKQDLNPSGMGPPCRGDLRANSAARGA